MAGAADRQHAVVTVAGALPRAGSRGRVLLTRALEMPPSLVALALAGVAMAAHLALGGAVAPGGSAGAAGALLAAAGLSWAAWAWALFRAAGTPLAPSATSLQLIEEGPYRVGRNPMYLGTAFMLLGAALGLGVPLLAIAAVLFGVIVNAVHIPREEAQLMRRFGGWYRDYAGARRRWV
jgi:protein-S-isoprenylcysteine O-methyltransferase Ste14